MEVAVPYLIVGALAFAIVGGRAAALIATAFAKRPASTVWLSGACGAVALSANVIAPSWPMTAASLFLGWTLVVLAAVDTLAYRLPNIMTLPLIAAGLGVSVWTPHKGLGSGPLAHIVGAFVGYLILAGIAWCYRRYRGRDGLGLGDAKLLAAAGAWLGWRPLPSVVFVACALALVWIGATRRVLGKKAVVERIAFGAPLALAIWIAWLYGLVGTAWGD